MSAKDIVPVIDRWLEQRVVRGETPGLAAAIVENGEVLLLEGHGVADIESGSAFDPDTRVPIASLTKQFTAAAVMMMVEEGLLSLETPVDDYLDGKVGSAEINLRHLLTHTAGLAMHGAGRVDLDYKFHPPTDPSAALIAPPSTRATYSNWGYSIIGDVLAAVAAKPIGEVFVERIFEPLGMTDTGANMSPTATGYLYRSADGKRPAVSVDPRGYSLPGSDDLISTAADLVRWLVAWTTPGILPDRLVRESLRTQWYEPDSELRWGLGWQIASMNGRDAAKHDGLLLGFHHGIIVDRARNRAAFVLSNAVDDDAEVWPTTLLEAMDLADQEVTLSDSHRRFCGFFSSDWGDFALAGIGGETLGEFTLESTDAFTNYATLEVFDDNQLLFTSGYMEAPVGEKAVFTFDDQDLPEKVLYGSDEVRYLGSL